MKHIFLLALLFLAACTILPPTQDSPILTAPVTVGPAYPQVSRTLTAPITVEPAYPRLGMWWPNLSKQPLEKVARYDWVVLGSWQTDFLSQLLEINPNLNLLISTSASEVDYNPNDPSVNEYLQAIPAEWYLTQVGTTLREEINASQTNIPVEAVKSGNIDLFVAGDTALIDKESVFIENVDAQSLTLNVRRGYVRPAIPHPAGTRIAAHISFWPNSWVLNLSTLSPTATIDPAIGPQRWADYNAILGTQLLNDARWYGIFIDSAGRNESWLIGNSTARSIDPDQSNHLITDYSNFNTTWNEGLSEYLEKLRAAIGPNRIILLNGGIPQYEAANGRDFEGFPSNQDPQEWQNRILGPFSSGSYFEWMSIVRQPNLTTIETYEDNSHPKPNDTNGYLNNKCDDPKFIPDYRKMRFGLTSALLNNGYFSYELNTEGHGSLCLMWFDEYDNAGAGRGYLGYPLGNAYRLVKTLKTPNQIKVGEFESAKELSAWHLSSKNDQALTDSLDHNTFRAIGAASVRLDSAQASGAYWDATFSFAPLSIEKGLDYTISFYARAEKPRSFSVWVEQSTEPWTRLLNFGEFHLSDTWQKFELPAMSVTGNNQTSLVFGLGNTPGTVWLDGVSLQEGNMNIWRRDYDNGIVIVNATSSEVVIPLETSFKKITGTQDRSTNDGAQVTAVKIPPYDGIILLR